MNAAYLTIFVLICFYLGFRYYSLYISKNIFNIDEHYKTPANYYNDGIDYVPTSKHILFGHHFTSIAGAAPIIGPCIAVYWGWLPAILWILIGTIFMGAVHDFGALVISVKEKGKSIANITSSVINKRAKIMFLIFVMLLTWLVLAVFAMAIAGLFVSVPSAVIPINIEIIIAIIIGYLIHRKGYNALLPSIFALILLYFFIWVGTIYPISLNINWNFKLSFLELWLDFSNTNAKSIWIILLFLYSSIASLLPVWTLLQPRDFINSHQLIVGLSLIFLAIFLIQPSVDAPMIRSSVDPSAPPIFPMLFVTIACGAISGFHGLVSSGTTSKQIDKLPDTRLIGYGAMLGEGTLALASTIAAVAGISLVTNCSLPSIGIVENLNWNIYYDSWAHASVNKATAFVLGGGALIEKIGFPNNIAKTIIAVMVISFAATTLDTATRIQRLIITELGSAIKIKILQNRYIATSLAIIPAIILTLWSTKDPSTGNIKEAAWILWPIFGASNQMLAALTLLVICLYFWKRGKRVLSIIIPMIIIMIITVTSLIINFQRFYIQGNLPLLYINCTMIGLILWMIVEGVVVFLKKR